MSRFLSVVALGATALLAAPSAEAVPPFPVLIEGEYTYLGIADEGSLTLYEDGTFEVSTALLGTVVGDWRYRPATDTLRGQGPDGYFEGQRTGMCFDGDFEYVGISGVWTGCVQ